MLHAAHTVKAGKVNTVKATTSKPFPHLSLGSKQTYLKFQENGVDLSHRTGTSYQEAADLPVTIATELSSLPLRAILPLSASPERA